MDEKKMMFIQSLVEDLKAKGFNERQLNLIGPVLVCTAIRMGAIGFIEGCMRARDGFDIEDAKFLQGAVVSAEMSADELLDYATSTWHTKLSKFINLAKEQA